MRQHPEFSQNEGRTYTSLRDECAGAVPLAPTGVPPLLDMAIYSMRMQVIGRSAGRSATAAAAYRSGEQLKDERTGQIHDYTGKSDIYGSEILKPEHAPERLGDRVMLWNEVERVEKRKDAQLSREVMIALPVELTHGQKQALTREYVKSEFVEQGMIADICYHDFNSHNPHAHIMLTMRSVDEEGFGKKRREWNKRKVLERQRKAWEEYANRALERAGYDERIDHRSLKDQGIEREPQIHLGAQVLEMEARGVRTRVGDESRCISKVNRGIARRQENCEKVRADIDHEQRLENLLIQPIAIVVDDLHASNISKQSPQQNSDLDLPHDFNTMDRRVESAKAHGVAESIFKDIDPELLGRGQSRSPESETLELPVEKKQNQAKGTKPSKQRDKNYDCGMEW